MNCENGTSHFQSHSYISIFKASIAVAANALQDEKQFGYIFTYGPDVALGTFN